MCIRDRELTQIVQNLSQDVSTETRLSLLPFIENPADEMEKKADEDQENFDKSMQAYKNLGGHEDEEKDLLAKEK